MFCPAHWPGISSAFSAHPPICHRPAKEVQPHKTTTTAAHATTASTFAPQSTICHKCKRYTPKSPKRQQRQQLAPYLRSYNISISDTSRRSSSFSHPATFRRSFPFSNNGYRKGFCRALALFPIPTIRRPPFAVPCTCPVLPYCRRSRIMSSSPFSDAFPADPTRRFLCLSCSLCVLLSDAGHIAAVVVGLVSPLLITSKKYFPCKLLIIRKLKTLTKNIYLYLLTKRKHCITFVSSNAEAIPQTFTTHHHTMLSGLSTATRFAVEWRPGVVFVFSYYDTEADTAYFRAEGDKYDTCMCPQASTIPVTIL